MASNATLNLSNVTASPETVTPTIPLHYGLILEFVIVVVVLGNLLVIVALLSYRQWTAADVFLFSLSLADLLDSLVSVQLITVVKYFLQKPMTKPICDAFVVLVYFFRTASATTVTLMAVERSLLLARPIKHHTAVTSKKITKLLLGVWLFSVISSALPLMGFGNSGYHDNECYYQLHDLGLEYAIFIEVFGAIMLSIVLLSYFAVKLAGVRFIKRQLVMAPASISVNRPTDKHAPPVRARSNSQAGIQGVRRLTTMMALVVVIYYISWLPFLLTNLASLVIGQRPSLKMNMFTSVISLLHALANPVLYGCMSQRYKTAYVFVFKTILSPCGGQRPPRLYLSVSRRSSAVPSVGSNRLKSVSKQNIAFQLEEADSKPEERVKSVENVEVERKDTPKVQGEDSTAVLGIVGIAEANETNETRL